MHLTAPIQVAKRRSDEKRLIFATLPSLPSLPCLPTVFVGLLD
jgi:hypothetical protein